VVPEKQGLKLLTRPENLPIETSISGGSRKTRIETHDYMMSWKNEMSSISGGSRKTRIETQYVQPPYSSLGV